MKEISYIQLLCFTASFDRFGGSGNSDCTVNRRLLADMETAIKTNCRDERLVHFSCRLQN